MRSLLWMALWGPVAGGCFMHNISASERVRDAVVGINDEIRWNRRDLALQRVVPTYRQAYASTHHSWGRTIQIADTELLEVELEDDGAVSVVAVSWYSYTTMTLRRTVIRQSWVKADGAYLLSSEEVLEGDGRLLVPPREANPREASPGEASPQSSG